MGGTSKKQGGIRRLLRQPLEALHHFEVKLFGQPYWFLRTSQVALEIRNLPASTGDISDVGSIPGLARSPGGGHGNPLQYACLANPMDKEAWQATVHRGHKNMDMT